MYSDSSHSSLGGTIYHSIGANLMGTVGLADLCSRTVETSVVAAAESCSSNNGPCENNNLPPPPPLSSFDKSVVGNNEQRTKEVANGGGGGAKASTTFDVDTSLDSLGFPRIKDDDITSKDNHQNKIVDTLLNTESWNTETGTFSFEDKFVTTEEEHVAAAATSSSTSPVQQSTSNDNSAKRRITMFGSEYARILSSSSSKPTTTGGSKVKRSPSAVSNKIKARLGRSVTNHTSSSTKESVESVIGGGIPSLDECPTSVATAAITDVIVTSGSEVPPRGYYRAFQLGEESTKNMVPGRKRQRLYLNVKKEPSWDRAAQRPCVTAFCIIYPDRNEFVPPGFSVVRHHQPSSSSNSGNEKKGEKSPAKSSDQLNSTSSPAANINISSSGERVYICYRRSREGNPITGIICLRPSNGDVIPEGYTVLERTPRNFLANMAAKSEQPLFLAYRQRLENLECLRPLPLVLSVLHARSDAGRKELKAYYCTGGVVVSSDVGRYHIMDRTTHTLMSSSSAQSRLNLIQSSRKESETAVPEWVSSVSSHSSSSQLNANNRNAQSRSASSSILIIESPGQSDELHSFDDSGLDDFSRTPSQHSLASNATSQSSHQSPAWTKSTLFSQSEDALQTTLDAMYFIPSIECAKSVFQLDDATNSESTLQSRIAAITPILTACYTAQGGSSLIAVEGLITLLNETRFFAHDVANEDNVVDDIYESSVRLTILDLCIQVVCDVATTSARETYFRSCVDFVSDAVRYSGGKLNDRTIGFVLRFYLFVFYFGASIPTNGWPFNKSWDDGKIGILNDFLLPDSVDQKHVDGGAPQAAAIALKEFITIILARIRTGGFDRVRHPTESGCSKDFAANRADVANYTQLALYQIHRSGGSELFWHDMIYSIGAGLFSFGEDMPSSCRGYIHSNTISFAIFASVVKICSGKVRMIFRNTEPVPRDVASKLLSFELLSHFINMWHSTVPVEGVVLSGNTEPTTPIPTMIYVIRRLVPPLLLSNTSSAIEDCRVYRRVVRIITQLWCNDFYRREMRLELAVLIEHYILKVLCIGPQLTSNEGSGGTDSKAPGDMPSLCQQQLDVLQDIKVWFSNNRAVALYVNYDNQGDDMNMLLPPAYLKLVNKLTQALSTLAEQCGAIISEHGQFASITNSDHVSPQRCANSLRDDGNSSREGAQLLRRKAFDALTAIAKSIMDCAAIENKQQGNQHLVTEVSEIDMNESLERGISRGIGLSPQISPVRVRASKSYEDENIIDYWKTVFKRKAPLQQPLLRASSFDLESPVSLSIKQSMGEDDATKQSQRQTNKQESFDVAFELIATKGLKKGIDYLIARRLLSPSPKHISAFLRIHQASMDSCTIGEYLGEGGVDGSDADFFNLIRFYYTRSTSFVGMTIDQAIRHYLTDCGFRLPGEAQKIDRIISTFSQCYWEDNAGDIQKCPFQDQDTVFLISFAIIMLNTDLHKSHATKGKSPKRMTKNEFITNLRGVCRVDKFRDYIYSIYDSIEATPIAISDSSSTPQVNGTNQGHETSSSLPFYGQTNLATNIQSWVKSVKPAQELLRTIVAQNDNLTPVVDSQPENEKHSLQASTNQLFRENWHHIHAAINATIDNAHLDLAGLGCCLDLLEYSLCTASYLGMTVERSAFSKILCRMNQFNDHKVKKAEAKEKKPSKESSNKLQLDKQLDFEDVGQVRSLTKKLHTSLVVDDTKMVSMKQVAKRIRNGQILMNDPSRTFVREGEMTKHHQLGRSSTYRFFLFSDVLVYAHKSSQGGDYKVHEELPLHLMKIDDGESISSSSNVKQCGFYIHHPSKSFLVIASSIADKEQWMNDINNSIQREVNRKAKIGKSRIDVARRANE